MAEEKVIDTTPLVTAGLKIEVDLDAFELEDWEKLDPSGKKTSMTDVLDVLDRLVVGGVRGRGLKGFDLIQIQQAVGEALKEATNPLVAGKN